MKALMCEKVLRISYVEAVRKIGTIGKGCVIRGLIARDVEEVYLLMDKWLKENGIERNDVRVRVGYVPVNCHTSVDIPKSWLSKHSLAIL